MQNEVQKVQELIRQLEGLAYCFSDQEDHEKQTIENTLIPSKYGKEHSFNISLVECHVIDCIGCNEMFNTTAIAKKLNVTRGGISKITTRLIKKNMIESYQMANNKKEIYYRLKPLGEKVFALHKTLHKDAEKLLEEVIGKYSQAELDFASRFLTDITNAIQKPISTTPIVLKVDD